MGMFELLPLELLPVIFDFVLKPLHISTLCLVNKSFNRFATPLLYRSVLIFAWYKDAKTKVILLFQTLSECPHLARYVEKLEIRNIPKAQFVDGRSDLLDRCAQGIRNCVNLRSCTWTRDGSLQSNVLESLRGCSQLHELEINGNDSGYDPILLTQFSRLSKISLIMPGARILDIVPAWISITGETLRNFTLVCKTSTLVTDAFLERLAPDLQLLEYLHIAGCFRVTDLGISAIASANKKGLIKISVEGLSHSFDMSAFKDKCLRTMAFRRLKTITLSTHPYIPLEQWTKDVEDLLSSAPLEEFSIYTMIWTHITDEFLMTMVANHGRRLKKFTAHRLQIGIAALKAICSGCPLLEQLFIVADQRELDDAVCIFALAKNLRELHINFPLATSEYSVVSPSMLMQKAASIASVCSPTLARIGCNTQVWQVDRTVREDEHGEKYVVRTLAPQENPDIPEQFLVVRA